MKDELNNIRNVLSTLLNSTLNTPDITQDRIARARQDLKTSIEMFDKLTGESPDPKIDILATQEEIEERLSGGNADSTQSERVQTSLVDFAGSDSSEASEDL